MRMPMPVDYEPIYLCPQCGAAHLTVADAKHCFASDEPIPKVKPGDLVLWRSGYAWSDGDKRWVYEVGEQKWHSGTLPHYTFWMVVTAITRGAEARAYQGDRSAHRWHTHVRTLGLKNGQDDGFSGWTSSGHVNLLKPKKILATQSGLRDEALKMIGLKFDRCL